MAKSILQEIATLNAESFNAAELKVNLYELEKSTERNLEESRAAIQNNEATLSINLNALQSDVADEIGDLKVQSVKTQVDVDNLKSFTFSEIANNYHVIGALNKDYKRNDQFIRDQIDNERLQKVSYFTGPIYEPVNSATSGFKTGYTGEGLTKDRPWVYFIDSNASYNYLNGTMMSLDTAKSSIVLGDHNLYQKVYCTGTLDVQTNLTIKHGVAKITSPLITDDSLTVNGNIVSSAGNCTVDLGYITNAGGYKATSGNFDTDSGGLECTTNIHSTLGSLQIDAGNSTVKTGYITNSGGFTASSGDFKTSSGGVDVTSNITSSNGKCTVKTGYKTTSGGFTASSGDFKTSSGGVNVTSNITSSAGKCAVKTGFETSTGGLNITSSGDIYTKSGDIKTDNGNLIVVGTGTFNKKLIVNDDGADFFGGTVTIGTTASEQDLIVHGNINLHGEITYGESGGSTQNHTANGNLIVTETLSTDGNLLVGGNLEVTGTTLLKDTLTSNIGATLKGENTIGATGSEQTIKGDLLNIKCNVDAGSKTITAAKFEGVATSAYYGDVAENYLSDYNYEPGTLLSLGGDKEVTLYDPELPLAGVVSTNPGLELNDKTSFGDGFKDHGYIFIALTGRVPARTKQSILKGEYIFPDDDNPGYVIGVTKSEMKNMIPVKLLDLIGVALSNSIEDEFYNNVEIKV